MRPKGCEKVCENKRSFEQPGNNAVRLLLLCFTVTSPLGFGDLTYTLFFTSSKSFLLQFELVIGCT